MYHRRSFIVTLLIQHLVIFVALSQQNQDDLSFCEPSPKLKLGSAPELDDKGLFRAAIFEHRRVELTDPKASAEANLAVYEKVAEIAAENGAKILVLPEDGLFGSDTVEYMEALVEEIPDPDGLSDYNNNPCQQPTEYAKELPILSKLSCIARANKIYLVANYGTKMRCVPKSQVGDTKCPDNGRFLFNTNVVLDSQGNFIKRYRKYNLFVEVFDRAPTVEHAYFDTPFGRFGLITCFDLLFARPAIDLVEKFNINTMLLPTWWYDELPFLAATQFQDSWSWTNNINLLASNIHVPSKGSVGSSISSGNYSVSTSPADLYPKLLLANLPKRGPAAFNRGLLSGNHFDAKAIDISHDTQPNNSSTQKYHNYWRSNFVLQRSDSTYRLNSQQGSKSQCVGTLCCTADYMLADGTPEGLIDRLVVVARNGLRQEPFKWYEQICGLATLEGPDQGNATKYNLDGLAAFKALALRGTFEGRYVYPVTARNVSVPVARSERHFSCNQIGPHRVGVYSCQLVYDGSASEPISTFGMYGRVYERDQIDYSLNNRHLKQEFMRQT